MLPENVVYDICRYYICDQQDVDPALVAKVDGFRRSRNLAGLASCSSLFDWAKHTVGEWRFLRQVEAFFKKNSVFTSSESRNVAEASFREAETRCGETNLRLDFFYVKRDLLDPDLNFQISRMERYIRNVLGDFHSFTELLPGLVRVTPGATSTTRRDKSLPQLKMKLKLYSTSGAAAYLRALYRYFGFDAPRLRETNTNRVELVPKNWKTDRTIACEPEGNLPLQLAFDTYAKRRLRRVGIDLRDQSANQRLAAEASVTNEHVTVDFSQASDTLSFNTVAWLLPYDWFSFLCRVRSPNYRGAFGEGVYQKFSSMGNGCTFSLETLIFAAACYAVGARRFLVYGDDVIIERECYDAYLRLTRFLGFTINREKSFHDGPFRESCGLDAYDGVDVTPVYIRGIDDRKAVKCHLVNTLAPLTYPGSQLGKYLSGLVRIWKLPAVPYQESTVSGVWIHPDTAREQGILRERLIKWRDGKKYPSQTLEFKSFVAKTKPRPFVDIRGYYLWFLNKHNQVLFGGPWFDRKNMRLPETSSVPIYEHSYVRKWVVWSHPHNQAPGHLHWWPEE